MAVSMKPSTKVYIIVIVCACVILYQYHLYNTWNGDIIQRVDNNQPFEKTENKDHNFESTISQQINLNKILSSLQAQHNVFNSDNSQLWDRIRGELNSQYEMDSPSNDKPTSVHLPKLYIITPTYRRAEQLAELTRISHTLMHVPNVHWLVIEDADVATPLVTQYLQRTGLTFDHLTAPMPKQFKQKKVKPRGVSNRNRGLDWIRANATTGVFYFADDDNTYDLQLFKQMRYTKRVSMWPVGLITKLGVSSPIVRNGTLVGFYDGWIANRKFPVDMAGFAVNVEFLLTRPDAKMPYRPGFEEDGFLLSLKPLDSKDIELMADNCTKILTWHTQTKKNEASLPLDLKKYSDTNLIELKKILV